MIKNNVGRTPTQTERSPQKAGPEPKPSRTKVGRPKSDPASVGTGSEHSDRIHPAITDGDAGRDPRGLNDYKAILRQYRANRRLQERLEKGSFSPEDAALDGVMLSIPEMIAESDEFKKLTQAAISIVVNALVIEDVESDIERAEAA